MASILLNVPSGDPDGIDMSQIFGYDDSWSVVSVDPSAIGFSDGIRIDYFFGTNLAVDANGNASGTVTSWVATDIASGFVYASIAGVSVAAATVKQAIDNNTEAALLSNLLVGADTIVGSSGADIIDGHAGADTMSGQGGNDTYYVDTATDTVLELTGGGTDLVRSKASSYTLAANVENGQIDATGTASLTGNTLDNTIYAGAGNNVMNGVSGTDTVSYANAGAAVTVSLATTAAQATGGSGSDTLLNIDHLTGSRFNDTLTGNSGSNRLDGGTGADRMTGGDGNDTYVVDHSGDVVVESSTAGGTDIVYSYLSSYTLGSNIENGRITTSATAGMTGNSLNNVLIAGSGNNVLNGGNGTDTADYSTATKAVAVSLAITTAQATGGSGSDTLTSIESLKGSSYNDTLTGNSAGNKLDGGAGADKLTGGDGSDTYYVDNAGDVVTETNTSASTGGTDTVFSTLANYTLTANVENGRVNTTAAANLTGNGLDNVLAAGAGNNVLNGGSGVDTADFSTAAAAVTVSLAVTAAQATGGSGSDTLTAIENLLGSGFNDTLSGSSGANVLTGGAGSDKLTGGGGADRFVLNSLSGSDTITDFLSGTDKLAINPTAIVVGDGDATLEGAVTRSAAGGFATTAELVVFTSNISGSITTTTAAAKIGAATSAYAVGAHALFAVDNGSSSALYLFTSSSADATVSASELTLLATLGATPGTTTTDYLFGS